MCRDQACLTNKILAHRRYRDMSYWQSMLMHRYARAVQDGLAAAKTAMGGAEQKAVTFFRARVKHSGGAWFISRVSPNLRFPDATLQIQDVPDVPKPRTKICIAEVWDDDGSEGAAANFHVVLFVCDVGVRQPHVVALPFSTKAAHLLQGVDIGAVFSLGPGTAAIHVQQGENPYLSLLWLHVALLQKGNNIPIAQNLTEPLVDERGTALFELHLIDYLVPPCDPGEVWSKYVQPHAKWVCQVTQTRGAQYERMGQ
jgi:hypothetical protein